MWRANILSLPLLPVLLSCAVVPQETATPATTDPTLSRTTYYEEGQLAFMAIDCQAASVQKDGSIFPLAFMLANKTNKAIRINAEDFTLLDSRGERYPMESYETYREHYRRSAIDKRLSEQFVEATNHHLSIDESMLSTYRQQPLPFYADGTPRSDSLQLGPRQFTRGLLYFPVPESGLKNQILELHLASRDFPQPLFVKFRIE